VAEEIENAAVVIPRSMVAATLINGSLGLGMTIGILFVIGNLDTALSSPTGFPFIEIFRHATGSDAGTTAMTCLMIVILVIATVGIFISTSRMTWAFARERGIPGAGRLGRVHEGTRLPLYSIALTALIAAILALINIVSTTAFNALISLVVASFYSNFLLAAGVMLYKRLSSTEEIQYGPFKLGRAGVPVTILAMMYSVIGTFFSFWPPAMQVTAASMNWSSVVFVGSLLLSLVFWFTHGRVLYAGPIMEISSAPEKEKA
jgi:choline transport protein